MPTDDLKWGDPPAGHPGVTSSRAATRRRVDDERVRMVEAFRVEVAAGVYRVDSLRLADRLLDERVLEADET